MKYVIRSICTFVINKYIHETDLKGPDRFWIYVKLFFSRDIFIMNILSHHYVVHDLISVTFKYIENG